MQMSSSLSIAQSLVDSKVKPKDEKEQYIRVYTYALVFLEKMYNTDLNGLDKSALENSVVLHDILKYYDDVEAIEKEFGQDVAMVVFNIADTPDDINPMTGYERLFKNNYDFIFVKLVVRISRMYDAIISGDDTAFKGYINEYGELRRKLLKQNPDMKPLMDYESELIKFGRNHLSGKPASEYQYEQLILTDG